MVCMEQGLLKALGEMGTVEWEAHCAVVTVVGKYAPYFTEMCSGSEAGSYLRLIDFCITQL